VTDKEKKNKTKALAKRSSEIAVSDTLSHFLAEIKKYPKLTKDQELEIAKKFYETKDLDSAYKLVQSNLWLVVKIARDYQRAAKNILDLVQEGNIGLMEAVKNFNPYKDVRLPTYASFWIKAYIVRYLINNWRMVKIGTTQAQRKLFFNLKKEVDRLESLGYSAEPKLIAQNLDVKEKEVIQMQQRLSKRDLSVDAPIGEGSSDYHSVLPSSQIDSEAALEKKQTSFYIKKAISEFKKTLKEKQSIIFNSRMISENKKTLSILSKELGLSMERVRQIENEIKLNFKDFIEENYKNELSDISFDD